jgi:CheY-like chemotaxis protein
VLTDTYVDEGKSALCARTRPGLYALLNDVISGRAAFRVLLIYDVSRLGRFQDIDEAAHYEFLCKEAGISVHYCAEEFGIECNVQNSLMKALKRTMAAQFSRELSERVFEAKHRMADLVLLDYAMRGADGEIVVHKVKRCKQNVPLIAVSANPIPEEALSCADCVVTREKGPVQLLKKIEQYLRRSWPATQQSNR